MHVDLCICSDISQSSNGFVKAVWDKNVSALQEAQQGNICSGKATMTPLESKWTKCCFVADGSSGLGDPQPANILTNLLSTG